MKIKCDYCQKTLDRRPSRILSHKFHFCDRRCFRSFVKIHPDFFSHAQTLETRKKIADKKKGKKFPKLSLAKKGSIPWNKGLTMKTDARVRAYALKQRGQKRIGNYRRGKEHYAWKGGYFNRNNGSWFQLANRIKKRDNFRCQCCGAKNVRLEVHHLFPIRLYKNQNNEEELVTLFVSCHKVWEKHFYELLKAGDLPTPQEYAN